MFHCETCTRILYYIEPSGYMAVPAVASASAFSPLVKAKPAFQPVIQIS